MIIRIIAIDPNPREPNEDIIVYQVPEHSRAAELLISLLDGAKIEWVDIKPLRKTPKEPPL